MLKLLNLSVVFSKQLHQQQGFIRMISVASHQAKDSEITFNKSLSLQLSKQQPLKIRGANPPLVLLLGWLYAKEKHLTNFTNFYLNEGCDVLKIKTKPRDILLPEIGAQVLAKQVVDILQENDRKKQPIIMHGFSGGGYVYSEILRHMLTRQEADQITARIIGQIHDSVVDLNNISSGLATSLVKNALLQRTLKKTLELYMCATHNFAGRHHERGVSLLWNNPVKAPLLFLYSESDPLSPPCDNQRWIVHLRKVPGQKAVYEKMFKNSPHVCHMHKYREEYVEAVQSFLNTLDYQTASVSN